MSANQDTTQTAITHDGQGHRFVTSANGHEASVEYELGDGVMTITHTLVPKEIGGRGIAGHLVRAAMDHARAAGLKVVPQCSYADSWLQRHPDYAGLRA